MQPYQTHIPGRIILVGHHLSAKTHIRCIVKSISLYGAVLEVSPYLSFPNNFFLEILGIRDEIGCTIITREEEIVTIGFNMLLAQEFLMHVLRLGHETTH
ncbi:MAG: hypothetical protein J0I23_04030 [Rhizobiales bacterium]|nr:hypothetical protein [Hyphomicrobiales bacterium]